MPAGTTVDRGRITTLRLPPAQAPRWPRDAAASA